jgi:PucR-like helix-turn-helix protein/diguanylate cyclase with GGDEF domain
VTPGKASAERRFARLGQPRDGHSPTAEARRVADQIVASIRAEIPSFAEIEVDEIRRMVASDMTCRRVAVAEPRPPTPQELDVSASVTLGLARAGVPLDAINQSRRIAVRHIFDAWREDAQARGIDASTQLDHLYSLWSWTDAITARAGAVYPQTEAELEGRDEDQRAWFLRGVLDGTLAPAEAQARAAAYGLLPGGRYLALRGRPGADADARQLRRAVEVAAQTDFGGVLVGVVEGEVWGLVSRRPDIGPGQGVVGLGTAADLGGVETSFRLATRALETATAFGLDGAVGIDDLSLRPVVLSEAQVGERLMRRYLEPLRELGEFGTTLEHTVKVFLANDMRIDDSAKALIIHPNTLRHRIDRFQQLTGANLHRTEDVIELWWALQRRRVTV